MESKGNRQMVALSSPPLPFQERKPGLPGFVVSLHDERGCVEGMPDSKRGCRRLGLDQRHLEGRKGKAGQRGPFSPLLPSLPAGAELARGGGLTGTSCLGEGRVCSWELAANSLSYAGGMLLGALLSCVPQKSLGRTSASH